MVGGGSSKGARIMRKTEFAFWTFLLMTGLAGATTLLNVTRTYSATSENSELYRQLDLFGDYKSNVALYPAFQDYFRRHKPPFLAVWGKNDPFFLPPGAEAFKRDIPNATVRFFDTGHFALETHAAEIAAAIRDFLPR